MYTRINIHVSHAKWCFLLLIALLSVSLTLRCPLFSEELHIKPWWIWRIKLYFKAHSESPRRISVWSVLIQSHYTKTKNKKVSYVLYLLWSRQGKICVFSITLAALFNVRNNEHVSSDLSRTFRKVLPLVIKRELERSPPLLRTCLQHHLGAKHSSQAFCFILTRE